MLALRKSNQRSAVVIGFASGRLPSGRRKASPLADGMTALTSPVKAAKSDADEPYGNFVRALGGLFGGPLASSLRCLSSHWVAVR